jgi:hypothetical protein
MRQISFPRNMRDEFIKLRFEIAQEFARIEYSVRGYLSFLLAEQTDRPRKKYREQFDRFIKLTKKRTIRMER